MIDQTKLKSLIDNYQQKIFALVLYLTGNDKDKAYEITATSFAKALRTATVFEEGEVFLARAAALAVNNSRDVKVIPSIEESDLTNIPPARRKFFQIIRLAFQALPFDTKALLLLRDQLHLAYKDISVILRTSESNSRIQALQAREQLKEKIKEVLSRAR
ncbi:RNA polymerase sigma factor [Candidatus Omnitrophota bacterium]